MYLAACIYTKTIIPVLIEKNPGLFVQAAAIILKSYPLTRFIVVGDGILKVSLQELAKQLDIFKAFSFIGWISNDELPSLLASLDVVINTSLRGWSETFCIANIEAMSMAVPLITFAVGGMLYCLLM